MDNTAASTERTIHIRICHHLWIRAFNMYIFKIPGFYECPISWVHFRFSVFQVSNSVDFGLSQFENISRILRTLFVF